MKVLIGTPIAGGECAAVYTGSLFSLLRHVMMHRRDIELSNPLFISGALVAHSRNTYASRMLQDSTYTHLLFIDSDMGFRPEAIMRMIDFDKPVVGCVYPARVPGGGFAGSDGLMDEAPQQGFVRTKQLSTALMLIKREVFETLAVKYPQILAAANRKYQRMGVRERVLQCFEAVQQEDGIYLPEDDSFSRRWSECGGELWALVDERIAHAGFWTFEGRYSDHMQQGSEGATGAKA